MLLYKCSGLQTLGWLIALLVIVVNLTGCGAIVASPVPGVLYTDVKGPLTATSATIDWENIRSGSAIATSTLGLVATGDASIATAARNGGIKQIYYVDYQVESFLGLFAKYTVTVYGM